MYSKVFIKSWFIKSSSSSIESRNALRTASSTAVSDKRIIFVKNCHRMTHVEGHPLQKRRAFQAAFLNNPKTFFSNSQHKQHLSIFDLSFPTLVDQLFYPQYYVFSYKQLHAFQPFHSQLRYYLKSVVVLF